MRANIPAMTSPRDSRRSGRARLAELVVWDVVLLCLVIGLFVVEQNLPAQAAPPPPRTAPPPKPTTPAPPTQPPPRRPPGQPGRMPVVTEAPATEAPARVTEAAPPPAPGEDETAEREARALLERGDVEAAVGRADRALRALAAQGGKAPKGLQDVAREAQAKLVAADAAAVLLPDVQLLADAGKKDEVDKLLAPFAQGAVPGPLASERERARERAGKAPAAGPGGGFQIKAFNPEGSKLEGRRCSVEGDAERARLEVVRDAVDGVLLLAEGLLAGALPGRVTVKLQPADAPAPAPAPLVVNVHLRGADEPVAHLVDRARLAAARAAWTTLGGAQAGKAPAWLSGGIPRYLAGIDPTARPAAPTALGRAWAREARRRQPADLVGPAAASSVDPPQSFALVRCAIDGPEEGCEPLRRFLRAALTRLEAGEAVEGAFPTLDPAQSGRLADACRAFLAEGTP
jgi:hypothetical protein